MKIDKNFYEIYSVMSRPVGVIDLPTASYNALRRFGVKTVAGLWHLCESDALGKVVGMSQTFSKKTEEALIRYLDDNGIEFVKGSENDN